MLKNQLSELIRACFTGLWVHSHEHPDVKTEVAELCREEHWQLVTWNIDQGLSSAGQEAAGADPLAAIRALGALAVPAGTEGSAILILENFHRFLQSAEIVQALAQQIIAGKQNRTFIVILSPIVQIPTELEKLFIVLEHDLPNREQLCEIAQGIATQPGDVPDGADLARVLDAAAGLTRYEAEGAFSLSLVRIGKIEPEAIWSIKSQQLKKSGLVTLHRGQEKFTDLGGLDALKAFCLRALRPQSNPRPERRPRGALLLGVPGTGKSAFAKALGNETGRPTLLLDVGSLMGSLVGQTEQRTRDVLRIADAMAPCILFCDELEKALSGGAGGGQTDGGVGTRLFGTLLTWLNDHASDVFFLGTCNDISKLPPEFSRAERFDGVFFLDLPDEAQRQVIWRQYLQLFELDSRQARPDDAQWTGAEIRASCRLAALLDLPLVAAAQNVVPVAVTAAESVERLRTWASGRCLSADHAGIYCRPHATPTTRRKLRRGPADPSSN